MISPLKLSSTLLFELEILGNHVPMPEAKPKTPDTAETYYVSIPTPQKRAFKKNERIVAIPGRKDINDTWPGFNRRNRTTSLNPPSYFLGRYLNDVIRKQRSWMIRMDNKNSKKDKYSGGHYYDERLEANDILKNGDTILAEIPTKDGKIKKISTEFLYIDSNDRVIVRAGPTDRVAAALRIGKLPHHKENLFVLRQYGLHPAEIARYQKPVVGEPDMHEVLLLSFSMTGRSKVIKVSTNDILFPGDKVQAEIKENGVTKTILAELNDHRFGGGSVCAMVEHGNKVVEALRIGKHVPADQ